MSSGRARGRRRRIERGPESDVLPHGRVGLWKRPLQKSGSSNSGEPSRIQARRGTTPSRTTCQTTTNALEPTNASNADREKSRFRASLRRAGGRESLPSPSPQGSPRRRSSPENVTASLFMLQEELVQLIKRTRFHKCLLQLRQLATANNIRRRDVVNTRLYYLTLLPIPSWMTETTS